MLRFHGSIMRRSAVAAPSLYRQTLRRFEHNMPPGYAARVGKLETFALPDSLTGAHADIATGKALVAAWQRDGIFQIEMSRQQQSVYREAIAASKRFFRRPLREKVACVDALSYSGYISSGEELTDSVGDANETFTVCKDLGTSDPRVLARWPCHGPCPWPDHGMRDSLHDYMDFLGRSGEKLLGLLEFGLGIPEGSLTRLTRDGWHHLRMLRFPTQDAAAARLGNKERGIGSHTDYGLLVIAAQDDVGGLFIRPPYEGEHYANWQTSAAGLKQDDDGWVYVPPVANVFTVFPGDMMQYMTNSHLPATPHKVGLNTRERFAFAYFHEPCFQAVVKPLPGFDAGQGPREGIHYGTHFTDMFIRNYPDRVTTERLLGEKRYGMLRERALRTMLEA